MPKHLVSDQGPQFASHGYKARATAKGINLRFGAVGMYGTLAVLERFILTLKTGCTRIIQVPMMREAFRSQLSFFLERYHELRPHMGIEGKTPNEVSFDRQSANKKPRFEPRPHWPRGAPCAKQPTRVQGQPGVKLELDLTFHEGCGHLPIIA